jgi:hypothetical protein
MIEIVVESMRRTRSRSTRIPDDIIEQGREEYWELVKILAECEARDEWPGPGPADRGAHAAHLGLQTGRRPRATGLERRLTTFSAHVHPATAHNWS